MFPCSLNLFLFYPMFPIRLIKPLVLLSFLRSRSLDLKNICTVSSTPKVLITILEGNSEFCFPRISMFPETKSRETLRLEGNKIHTSPRDQSLSDLLYSKTIGSNRWKAKANSEKRAEIPATTSGRSDHVQQWSTFRG